MSKRFTNKMYNKVVAKVDRHFTWDRKSMDDESVLFIRKTDDNTYIAVYVRKPSQIGMYLSIDKHVGSLLNDPMVEHGVYAKSYHEINEWIKLIKLIG